MHMHPDPVMISNLLDLSKLVRSGADGPVDRVALHRPLYGLDSFSWMLEYLHRLKSDRQARADAPAAERTWFLMVNR